jgi:DNA (cytosine-5)-methyltransferase 1
MSSGMTVGGLFSGIGGIELGLERAGFRIAWHAEKEPYASTVLKKHWPDVPNLGDVTTIDWSEVERPTVICGGFPCQPVSSLGTKSAADDDYWLWPYFARAVRDLRPEFVVVENVAGLRYKTGGLGIVLGDLAALGYDAEWESLPAGAFGALHRRERIWIVAYPQRRRFALQGLPPTERQDQPGAPWGSSGIVGDAPPVEGHWEDEPDVGRVADGVTARVDRLRCLGNAVVPVTAEWVGVQIMAALAEKCNSMSQGTNQEGG